MNKVAFETDTGVLAVFEPRALVHRMRQPGTWWRESSVLDLAEVLDGKIALFPIGVEGTYTVRATLDSASPLAEEERPLLVGTVAGLGVSVVAEDVFVGAAERLPGDGIGDRIVALPGTGGFLKVPPGDYLVSVLVLDWRTKRGFFDEQGEPREQAPPDFVVVLARREQAFDAPLELRPLLDLVPRAEASKEALRVPKVARRAPEPARVRGPSPRPEPREAEESERLPVPAFGFFEVPLVRRAFRETLREAAPRQPGQRFAGGTIVLRPRDPVLAEKELAVSDLLTKVTRIRDEMRVLEQKINSHETLEESAKLDLDAHVTDVYDALVAIVGILGD